MDVPQLVKTKKIIVWRRGNVIYKADADQSLLDLLTKRYNPKQHYSQKARKIFPDLNLLANMPPHPSSGKYRLGSGTPFFYSDPKELANRLHILVGSRLAGNNCSMIKNEISQINDELLKLGMGHIDSSLHQRMYDKYIK